MTENSCCDGAAAVCCLRGPALVTVDGARVEVRFKCRCIAVVPDAPPATIQAIVAPMAAVEGREGEEELGRSLADAGGGCCFEGCVSVGPACFLNAELGSFGLLLRLAATASRGVALAAPALRKAAAAEWEAAAEDGARARSCLDDARASACAVVAFAASLVYSQS